MYRANAEGIVVVSGDSRHGLVGAAMSMIHHSFNQFKFKIQDPPSTVQNPEVLLSPEPP